MLAQAASAEIEEVVVTGTYIKGTPEDAALPVTTLQREDLAFEGSPTAIDLIKSLSFSQGADGETDQFQAGAGADRATINIRGLGPSRSLVLVNGRRTTWSPFAIGAQAQLLVDVNMLPSIALQRIEILRDGAAATYGSDAIAGVMNFITRSDFEGFEITASHKEIDDTDGDQELGIIVGTSFMDGRGHFVTSGSYIQRDQLRIADRDWSLLTYDQNTRGGWSSVGRPSVVVPLDRWEARPADGFTGLLATGVVDPNCELLGGARTTSGVLGNDLGGFCRFQYTAFDNLIEDADRWQWFTEASFDITDNTTLSLEFLLTDSDVPNWGTSPSYPPNKLVDENRTVRANNPGLVDMASKYPNLYGQYASCPEVYCLWNGDGGTQDAASIPAEWQEVAWFYGRYYGQDGPPRSHHRSSELMRFAAELEGQWDEIGWQISATYSESKRESAQGDTMVYRDNRARQGLGGFECEQLVPNEYDSDGNLNFSLDTVQQHAGQGPCQYWIPFSNSMSGANSLVKNGAAENPDFNPALDNELIREYMMTEGVSKGETSLLAIEGIVTGELGFFEMPAGAIDYAVGFLYRDETYETGQNGSFYDGEVYPCSAGPEIKDCTSGRTGLFGFLPPGFTIDEDRDIWALFTEFHFPITETLEGQLSVRHEDYGGDTGSTTDPKVAFRWQVTDSIGLRASYGSTFRGPTLNQIVSTNSSSSLQFVGATGAFKRIDTKGNPGLKPEEADTINVGFLMDKSGLISDTDNLFITLDYWSYDFTDPLVTEPFTNIVNIACPGGGACDPNNQYFDRLVFGSTSTNATDIEIINVNIVNGPDYETDGIDFTFRYGLEVGPGYLSADITGTRILSYDISAWEFGPDYDALGRLNYTTSLARTLAEWKGRGAINYQWAGLNLRWVTNYVHDYDYASAAPQPAGDATVKKHITHDLHATYTFMNDQLTVAASVINMGDEDPPYMSREFNYDAFTHNPFGRMYKIGLTYSLQR
jgi:outer membrane receptor protein involved in Fe transport